MREVERNIKKKYYRPEIISVGIDLVVSCGESNSDDGSQTEPPLHSGESTYDGNSKYIFPDSPASDNPFGGSTPNYR